MQRKLILGFHGSNVFANNAASYAERRGYQASFPRSLEQMLDETRQALACHDTTVYTLMDANFEFPGTLNSLPAEKVHALMKDRVASGTAMFLALTGNPELYRSLQEKHIPAKIKPVYLSEIFAE